MEAEKEFDKIIHRSAESGEVTPDPINWLKLEKKLDRRRYHRYLDQYKNISIAAVFLCLLACLFIISMNLDALKTASSNSTTYVLEDLKKQEFGIEDEFYASVALLNDIYLKAGLGTAEDRFSD